MLLGELLDVRSIYEEFAAGYIRMGNSPDGSAVILNYTEKAAFEGHWNDVTLSCRGLIFDAVTHEILARPFPKFFNYGQIGCPTLDLDSVAVVTDKMDGSLGILYINPVTGVPAIATRGSFISDQAIHATELWHRKYSDFVIPMGVTMLFEIVYPENRIVCDYGDMDDLVFLGSVEISSGESWNADMTWDYPGPKAEVLGYMSVTEALALKPRKGKEGVVLQMLATGERVKIKQEDYITLHKIVTGLNARSVWQAMVDGTIDELIAQVPDEFHEFVRGVEQDIIIEVDELVNYAERRFSRIEALLPEDATKRDFAILAKDENYSWALFNLWDGKPIRKEFLKRARPAHDYSPIKVSNDAD